MFSIGDFGFEVISHETVTRGEMVEERFVIAHYYQGKPLQVSNSPDFKDNPHWEKWKFVGKLSQDVYAPFNARGEQITDEQARIEQAAERKVTYQKVGTKRGADFRTRFFPIIYQRSVAAQRGVRMGTVDDAEVATATSAVKADLASRTLDGAITRLTQTDTPRAR